MRRWFCLAMLVGGVSSVGGAEPCHDCGSGSDVPMFGVYETCVTNGSSYRNKFDYDEISLDAVFTSPTGRTIPFWGFFDGFGRGGPGDDRYDSLDPAGTADKAGERSGSCWGLRFMPDELGEWTYTWEFSDRSSRGNGVFQCVSTVAAGPGPLRVSAANPYRLETATGLPLWPRVFYPGHGDQLCYPASVCADGSGGLYAQALDEGMNIFRLNMLPVWWWTTGQPHPRNPPDPDTMFLLWHQNPRPYGPRECDSDEDPAFDPARYNLFAWHRVEDHIRYLSGADVYVDMFQGVATKRPGERCLGPRAYARPDQWDPAKGDPDPRDYVKYIVARLAPFWNVMWNFTWEVDPGDSPDHRNGPDDFGRWFDELDPWDHIYTTHACGRDDDRPSDFLSSLYDVVTFEGNDCRERGGSPNPVMPDDVPGVDLGKPMFYAEGGLPLWRRDGAADSASDLAAMDLAWRYTLQGAYVCWAAHYADDGVPWAGYFDNDLSAYMRVLHDFMSERTHHWNLVPRRDLVGNAPGTYCSADEGDEVVVYRSGGGSFTVALGSGVFDGLWLNPTDGSTAVAGGGPFTGATTFTARAGFDILHLWRGAANRVDE